MSERRKTFGCLSSSVSCVLVRTKSGQCVGLHPMYASQNVICTYSSSIHQSCPLLSKFLCHTCPYMFFLTWVGPSNYQQRQLQDDRFSIHAQYNRDQAVSSRVCSSGIFRAAFNERWTRMHSYLEVLRCDRVINFIPLLCSGFPSCALLWREDSLLCDQVGHHEILALFHQFNVGDDKLECFDNWWPYILPSSIQLQLTWQCS